MIKKLLATCYLIGVFVIPLMGCAVSNQALELPTGDEYIVVEGVGYESPAQPLGRARLAAKLEATAVARRAIWDGLMAGRFENVDTGHADDGESLLWLVTNDEIFASRLRALVGDVQIYASEVNEKDRSVRVWLVLDRNRLADLVLESRVRMARGV